MSGPGLGGVLEAAIRRSGLTRPQLWLRYLGLGGIATSIELDSYVRGWGDGPFDDAQHDVVVQAINERFMELGLSNPVPYRRA
jgi:hypothetical protein